MKFSFLSGASSGWKINQRFSADEKISIRSRVSVTCLSTYSNESNIMKRYSIHDLSSPLSRESDVWPTCSCTNAKPERTTRTNEMIRCRRQKFRFGHPLRSPVMNIYITPASFGWPINVPKTPAQTKLSPERSGCFVRVTDKFGEKSLVCARSKRQW